MTLNEFINDTKRDLEKFRSLWMKMNTREPEAYIMEMDAGDWNENFSCLGLMEDYS